MPWAVDAGDTVGMMKALELRSSRERTVAYMRFRGILVLFCIAVLAAPLGTLGELVSPTRPHSCFKRVSVHSTKRVRSAGVLTVRFVSSAVRSTGSRRALSMRSRYPVQHASASAYVARVASRVAGTKIASPPLRC